jgi:hypothetical protein
MKNEIINHIHIIQKSNFKNGQNVISNAIIFHRHKIIDTIRIALLYGNTRLSNPLIMAVKVLNKFRIKAITNVPPNTIMQSFQNQWIL